MMYSGDGECAGRTAEIGGGMFLISSMKGRSVTIWSKSEVWAVTLVRRFSDLC